VCFCVWAPFADSVAVTGDFADWSDDGIQLGKGADGCWYIDVPNAKVGQEYKYLIRHGDKLLRRNDPRALQLTSSGDSSVIVDPHFDWEDDSFELPPLDQVIIYELHVGTFVRPDPAVSGTFHDAITKLDYLVELGVNVVEVMPCNAMWMDRWWGYTPDNIYAVDAEYGGRRAFMEFVKQAHKRGLGVILDVVYNHLSQDDGLDLWQFDGWSEREDTGGIYFYNDDRGKTPWNSPRPDFGRPEVRRYITDNAAMWLRDCHVDGLRVDATAYIRNTLGHNNDPEHDIPDGWKLLQELTDAARAVKPTALLIAEDLQGNDWIVKPVSEGGAGFTSQWDPSVAAILREELGQPADESRHVDKLHFVLENRTNNQPFQRVIYSESHDTDAGHNGGERLDEAIDHGHADGLHARRRAALAAAVLLTTPGVPMLFQGQEFEESGDFSHYQPLDWHKSETFAGMLQLHRHLIDLRLDTYHNVAGLIGTNVDVFHVDTDAKVVAYHRWAKGGLADDVVVIMNFANKPQNDYRISFPATGKWWARFNSDWEGYGEGLTGVGPTSVDVQADSQDKQHFTGTIDIAPYSVLIFSQDL